MLWTRKPKNNRSALRFSYSIGKDKRWLRAWIKNSCNREVSITTKNKIPSGSAVEIEFLQPDTQTSIILFGTVAHASYVKEHKCFYNEITLMDSTDQAAEILKQIKDIDMRIIRSV